MKNENLLTKIVSLITSKVRDKLEIQKIKLEKKKER